MDIMEQSENKTRVVLGFYKKFLNGTVNLAVIMNTPLFYLHF